jgi:hypothetical protein
VSEQSDALNRVAREKGVSLGQTHGDDVDPKDARGATLPWVSLPRAGEQLVYFAEEVGLIVGANGLYRRDSVPVTIEPETGRVEEMDSERFRTYIETQLVPFFRKETQYGPVRIRSTITSSEARGCLRSDRFRYPLRKLQRVNSVQLPVIRRDGRIELLPKGYDQASSIFTMKDALEYDETWTLERARLFLDSLLREFPFADARSKAAHITAMVAMFGTSLLGTDVSRLNFVYRANIPRSGKGLLAATAIVGPCGHVMIQSIPASPDELRKILDTEALNGSPYIFFDEVSRKLVNPALQAFLTANQWTGRLMHSQRKFVVPQTAITFFTGNNVELGPDLAGRCLLIDLHSGEANAQDRHIEHVIDERYLTMPAVRADLLSAMWALIRAWDEALPFPRPAPASLYRGFESFSKVFGGIVANAGYGDALLSATEEADTDYADMRAIVSQLAAGVSTHAVYEFSEIIQAARELNAFTWQLTGREVKRRGTEDEWDFELTPAARAWFGKLFSGQYGGTIFALADGRRVRFGNRGKNRGRRYTLEIIGAKV